MFFVEMKNHLVRQVNAETDLISMVAGTGKASFGGDGGPAIKARFSNPHSIALYEPVERRELYIADIGNHRIRRMDLITGIIETIAGDGGRQLPVDGQTARGNSIVGPRALFVHGDTLWIALREGHSVWRMELPGNDAEILRHIAGTGQRDFPGDDGPAKQATFNGPKRIAVGPQENVYVVDTENQAIRKIDTKSVGITTIADSGPEGRSYKGYGGLATAAKLDRPHGICVSRDGVVYIGDPNSQRVRHVSP